MIVGSAKEARKTKDGWAKYMREYRKARPDVMRKIDIKKKFGLEYDEYLKLLESQNNICAICKQPETKLDYRTGNVLNLSIDHCHASGKIRGLLCMDCNRAIGMLNDDVSILESAISYLKKGN
jgi:hypothetical protein